jgi:hypothetical protein
MEACFQLSAICYYQPGICSRQQLQVIPVSDIEKMNGGWFPSVDRATRAKAGKPGSPLPGFHGLSFAYREFGQDLHLPHFASLPFEHTKT